MDETLTIGILCNDFEEAKSFYVGHLDFDVKLDEVLQYGEISMKRLILSHRFLKCLEIEFHKPSNSIELDRVGKMGGAINLFTMPTKNLEKVIKSLKDSGAIVSFNETPYADFLTVVDPMGNQICLYQPA